jgi:hypothetical protein
MRVPSLFINRDSYVKLSESNHAMANQFRQFKVSINELASVADTDPGIRELVIFYPLFPRWFFPDPGGITCIFLAIKIWAWNRKEQDKNIPVVSILYPSTEFG